MVEGLGWGMIGRMTPPDALQALTEAEIGREIVRLVPQWYEAACGPQQYAIPVREYVTPFYSQCRLSSNLQAFLLRLSDITRELPMEHFIQFPSLIDVLLENLAIVWLRIHSPGTAWGRLFKYMEAMARRTYEGQPVSVNLIIREGEGDWDITEHHLQKLLDRLATSPLSHFTIDPELRLLEYGEVSWEQVQNPPSHMFHPEFLHPLHCALREGDVSVHLTVHGDIIILNKTGILAARRHRNWTLYDVRTLRNSLSRCLGNPHVGGNLFQVVLDLSFRRAGALLIYDPDHCMREHVLNSESVVSAKWRSPSDIYLDDCGQALIGRLLESTAIGRRKGALNRKRRLVEMACLDGAIIFDDDNLLAVGALIRSHPSVGNQLGARTTAAKSAYLWGSHPIKVSADGDVTVYFKSRDIARECDAVMNFL